MPGYILFCSVQRYEKVSGESKEKQSFSVFDYPEPRPVLFEKKKIPKHPGCGYPDYRLSS